jgi:hypothetical protein
MGGDRPRDQPWHLNATIGFICIVASSHSHLTGDNNGLLAFTTNNTKALRSPRRHWRLA